jgi:hypothetical protein
MGSVFKALMLSRSSLFLFNFFLTGGAFQGVNAVQMQPGYLFSIYFLSIYMYLFYFIAATLATLMWGAFSRR